MINQIIFVITLLLLLSNINNLAQCQSQQQFNNVTNDVYAAEKRVPNLVAEFKIAMDLAHYICI